MRIASGVQISSELEYLRMFVHSFLSVFCTSRHSSIAHPLYLSFRVTFFQITQNSPYIMLDSNYCSEPLQHFCKFQLNFAKFHGRV